MKEPTTFSPREISVTLNNASAICLRPTGVEISSARLRRMRNYASALLEPLYEHVTGGTDEETGEKYGPCLKAEELVAILVCAALFTQATYVTDPGHPLPQQKLTNLLFKKILDLEVL